MQVCDGPFQRLISIFRSHLPDGRYQGGGVAVNALFHADRIFAVTLADVVATSADDDANEYFNLFQLLAWMGRVLENRVN